MTNRGYDREFTSAVSGRARRRVGFSRESGEVTRFVVQFEYRLGDEWTPVVRYDHSPSDGEYDVTEERTTYRHLRDGEKITTEYIAPPEPTDRAFTRAEDHSAENLELYSRQFERWHDLHPTRDGDP